jgi:hypothetical protein
MFATATEIRSPDRHRHSCTVLPHRVVNSLGTKHRVFHSHVLVLSAIGTAVSVLAIEILFLIPNILRTQYGYVGNCKDQTALLASESYAQA